MKEEQTQPTQVSTKKSKSSKVLFKVLGVIVIAGLIGGSYYIGFKQGEKHGAQVFAKKITDTLNPINLLTNNPIVPGTVMGSILKIENNSISIKQANGTEKAIKITDSTQITKQSKTIQITDLKTDQMVTVFIQKNGKDDQATRILAR